MNTIGERCRAAGLRFGFHNHADDLQAVDGEIPLRIFLEGTEPELVTFEVDLFWLVEGGGDPLEYIETYPGRFELCHVKDRTAGGDMVDVGDGVIDFAAIFARAERAGLRHYFVEHDTPGDAAGSIEASFNHLGGLSV
jgi:sugar phosphate isomerase/epimerase